MIVQVKVPPSGLRSVAAAPANYTQSAFNAANTAAANTVISQGVNLTQNNNITAVNQYAASAYAKANSGGLFTGSITVGQDLYVTGNLTVAGNTTSLSATDLIINGLTGNSFIYADSNKTLTSVAPVNDGDMIQWNGSSFVASNTIDGGTIKLPAS